MTPVCCCLHAANGCTDTYPSPWVEDLHRTAQLPRRERAHAPVPLAPSMVLEKTGPEAAMPGRA